MICIDSFFEWLGAGRSDESRLYSTMDRVRGPVETLFWGEDSDHLYFRFDGKMEELDKGAILHVYSEENGKELSLPLDGTPLPHGIQAVRQEIQELKRENDELKQLVAELSLEVYRLEKTAIPMLQTGVGTNG